MALNNTQLQKIKDEINNDPLGLKYSSMSDSQIADAMNVKPAERLENQPRIASILSGESVPNQLVAQDITDAKAL